MTSYSQIETTGSYKRSYKLRWVGGGDSYIAFMELAGDEAATERVLPQYLFPGYGTELTPFLRSRGI